MGNTQGNVKIDLVPELANSLVAKVFEIEHLGSREKKQILKNEVGKTYSQLLANYNYGYNEDGEISGSIRSANTRLKKQLRQLISDSDNIKLSKGID